MKKGVKVAASIAQLASRFQIPGMAQVVPGQSGWPKVQVNAPAASGEIYLHGAHVTSWKPAGADEVLYLSPNSIWQEGKAIRGGVPICYPWFGDKADDPHAPAHGFVRTRQWQLESLDRHGDAVLVTLSTQSDESTRQWWPADFRLVYRVIFGAELVLELTTTNTGSAPLRLEEALHTYYAVGDASRAPVSGLDGVQYIDKTDSFRKKIQAADVEIAAETDRVYLKTDNALLLSDHVLQRRILVAKQNSWTTVVWNPWSEKSAGMKDLGEGQWKGMLCIEASNVGDYAVELAPGEQHTLRAETKVM
jgi:glucose-6-phosphate 1-epimerase